MTISIGSIHRAVLLACLVAIAAPVWAEEPASKKDMRARALEEFDANGDGKLDDGERNAAREKRRAGRKSEMLEKFDSDGDGEISRDERRAANESERGKGRARAMQKFDTDGDGVLSEEERQAAHAKRGGKRAAHGKRGKGDEQGEHGEEPSED